MQSGRNVWKVVGSGLIVPDDRGCAGPFPVPPGGTSKRYKTRKSSVFCKHTPSTPNSNFQVFALKRPTRSGNNSVSIVHCPNGAAWWQAFSLLGGVKTFFILPNGDNLPTAL